MTPDLSTTLGRLRLPSPLLAAAGTVGYGLEFLPYLRREHLGAVVLKTLTVQPRTGHPPPRLVETPSGMLNCVGLQNMGITAFVREQWPAVRTCGLPCIVSVLGETLEEWDQLLQAVSRLEGVTAVELNLSCPNLPHAGTPRPALVAHDADTTRRVLQRARAAVPMLPLLAKLTPDVTEIVPIAQAAADGGADAVVIGNTYTGMAIDVGRRRSKLALPTGGLSGPAIRPLTLRRVWEVARRTPIPVIGAGGIMRAEDALEYLIAGAAAVEIGTAHWTNPRAAARIATGLTAYLIRHRMTRIRDLVGTFQN